MSYNAALIHSHSIFSIRDSILRIPEYVSKCKEYNYIPGILDHGFLGGAFKFYKECKKQEIKNFTIGFEAYYAEDAKDKGSNYHLTVIAKNQEGWKNLCRLSSESYSQENFFRKPRIDKKMLEQYKNGLIVSTACLAGLSQQLLINNQIDEANAEIDLLHSIFKEDFYLEIHDHGIQEEQLVINHFKNYGKEKNIKVIFGLDSHYLEKSDKEIHTIFKNISYNSIGKEADSGFDGSGYHVWNNEEIKSKFSQEEIDNTIELGLKCNIEFKHNEYHLPKFDIPNKEQDPYEYLKDLCYKGLENRGLISKEYYDRLNFELEQMHLSNLEDYILIVADYCNWCKSNGIPVGPGRGSVGNSLLAIASGISEVDSLKYDLMFGRFSNKGRIIEYDFGV